MKPLKIWAYLDNFFFMVSDAKKLPKLYIVFWVFFPLAPPWKLWKKNCLKELKFCEVSENPKSSICWKFQLFISLGSKIYPSTLQVGNKLNKPFECTKPLHCGVVEIVSPSVNRIDSLGYLWLNLLSLDDSFEMQKT